MKSSIKIIYRELKVRIDQWCCCNVVGDVKTASWRYHPDFKSDIPATESSKPNDDIEAKDKSKETVCELH
jgi:hypothetical protein